MGQIYRYKDENNNIIYVGLVYGNALDDIHRRIAQHKQDKWTENFKGTIETLDIPEQYIPLTAAETDALETHFINKYLSAEHTCNANWQIGRGTIRFVPECIDQAAWKAVPPKTKTENQINRVQSKPVLIKSLYEDSKNLDVGYNLFKSVKHLIKQGFKFQNILNTTKNGTSGMLPHQQPTQDTHFSKYSAGTELIQITSAIKVTLQQPYTC